MHIWPLRVTYQNKELIAHHCIIHQEPLGAKVLNMEYVMSTKFTIYLRKNKLIRKWLPHASSFLSRKRNILYWITCSLFHADFPCNFFCMFVCFFFACFEAAVPTKFDWTYLFQHMQYLELVFVSCYCSWYLYLFTYITLYSILLAAPVNQFVLRERRLTNLHSKQHFYLGVPDSDLWASLFVLGTWSRDDRGLVLTKFTVTMSICSFRGDTVMRIQWLMQYNLYINSYRKNISATVIFNVCTLKYIYN